MTDKIKEWIDALNETIHANYNLSKVLDHRATIGQIREFIVENALKKILPSDIIIGSGQTSGYNTF